MKKDERVQMDQNAQKLMEIIRSEKHSSCPSKREFYDPEDWIEVIVGFGRDETVSIQVHKETIKAFEEWEQEQGNGSGFQPEATRPNKCITDNVGQNKTKRKMGEIARTLRYLVGGEDFTTGRRITPVGAEDISELVKRLRTLVDEYDKLVMDEHDNHCKD